MHLELARYHYDALLAAGADPEIRRHKHAELMSLFLDQLARALDHVPEGLGTGVV